jgi:hypothetical protein
LQAWFSGLLPLIDPGAAEQLTPKSCSRSISELLDDQRLLAIEVLADGD